MAEDITYKKNVKTTLVGEQTRVKRCPLTGVLVAECAWLAWARLCRRPAVSGLHREFACCPAQVFSFVVFGTFSRPKPGIRAFSHLPKAKYPMWGSRRIFNREDQDLGGLVWGLCQRRAWISGHFTRVVNEPLLTFSPQPLPRSQPHWMWPWGL